MERFKRPIVGRDGTTMMMRYRLIETRWGNLYVHHFLRSDADRDLHDHPWNFFSIILTTGYWEELPVDEGMPGWLTRRVWHRPGTIVRHQADDAHRVDLPHGKTTWTLIYVGPKVREWGFHTANGWVRWQDYVT